jgi:hypothetical protein
MFPSPTCLCHSGFHAFPQQLSFKFRDRSQDLKGKSSCWQCGVDVLSERNQIHAQRSTLLTDGQQQRRSIVVRSTLSFVPIHDVLPASTLDILAQLRFLHVGVLFCCADPNYIAALFSFMVIHPLRFRLAHRAFAAFRAICFRRLAETVFIRTFADLRPIAAKYSDSCLSIIFALYPKPLSIRKQQLSGCCSTYRN